MSDLDAGKCQERKEVTERPCKGVRGMNLPKEDWDLFMRSVRGKEEEKRCRMGAGEGGLPELLKACLPLCVGTPGAETPSPDNAAETMEDAGKPWK